MAILKVARIGHPVVRETAKPVPAAEIQGAWERNESRVSGAFYERLNLLLALRYQATP